MMGKWNRYAVSIKQSSPLQSLHNVQSDLIPTFQVHSYIIVTRVLHVLWIEELIFHPPLNSQHIKIFTHLNSIRLQLHVKYICELLTKINVKSFFYNTLREPSTLSLYFVTLSSTFVDSSGANSNSSTCILPTFIVSSLTWCFEVSFVSCLVTFVSVFLCSTWKSN